MPNKHQLIEGLNEDLNLELGAVLRFLYHSAIATGSLGHELREFLKKEIANELNHASFLADKISLLGGHPAIDPRPPKKVKTAREMLDENIAAERKLIANYSKRIKQAEECGERGLAIHLENMLLEETEDTEELERLER